MATLPTSATGRPEVELQRGNYTAPRRIQLSRAKGYRKPAGAIVVSRPSRWGNPLTMDGDREAAAEWFGVMLDLRCAGKLPPTHRSGHEYPSDEEIRAVLAGHDLCCWCPLVDAEGNRVPCHADVLLSLANPGWTP